MPRRPRNKDILKKLGNRLREVREKAELTQASLARLVNSSAPTISRLESGHMAPTLGTLSALATALNVPIATLFQDENEPIETGSSSLSLTDTAVLARYNNLNEKQKVAIFDIMECMQS